MDTQLCFTVKDVLVLLVVLVIVKVVADMICKKRREMNDDVVSTQLIEPELETQFMQPAESDYQPVGVTSEYVSGLLPTPQ